MKRTRLTDIFLLVAFLFPSGLLAQEQAEDEPAELCDGCGTETIVITATRSEQNRFEANRSIELVDEKRIEELQVRSMPEALDETTGVYLQQTNRGSGSPYIRGLVGPQNLILLDGIRFNTSTFRTGPNQYLALIDPMALQRIEVVRGPSSVLYGNGAMGGVIQALSLNAKPTGEPYELSGRGSARFSSADYTRAANLLLRTTENDLALLTGGSVNSYDTLRAGGGDDQPISDYFTGYWHGKFAYQPKGQDWSLSGAYFGGALRNTGRADQLGKGDIRFYDNTDHLAYLRYRHRGGEILRRVKVSLAFHRVTETIHRFACRKDEDGLVADLPGCIQLGDEQFTRKRRYEDVVDVLGADASVGVDLWDRRIRLNTGFEVYQEYIASGLFDAREDSGFVFEKQERGNYSDGSEYLSLGIFLHGNATVWDFGEVGRLCLTGGARFSHFDAYAPDVPDIGNVNYEHNGFVGSAGLQFLDPGTFNIYASFVQGFRAPNIQETTVVGDTGQKFNIPNPDLKPERSNTVEVGGRILLGPVEAGVNYFYSAIDNAIMWESTTYNGQAEIEGKPVVHLVNSSEGTYQGVEGNLTVGYWLFELFASMAWMTGDVQLEDGSTAPARRIPPLFGHVGIRYEDEVDVFFAEVLVRFALEQDRLHPQDLLDPRICETAPYSGMLQDPCDGTPGWVTLNARAGFNFRDNLRVILSLSNITDAQYRTHGSGFDAPGIDMRATLVAEF